MLNPFARVLGSGFVLALAFWLMLVIVYAIPASLVAPRLSESVSILESEGDHPYDLISGTSFDNYAAAIMADMSLPKGGNPFIESLKNGYCYPSEGSNVSALETAMAGEANAAYARY